MMKPIITNIKPPVLNWDSLTDSIFLIIFFIFDGNIAYKIPSIKRKSPKAIINSFMSFLNYWVLGFMLPKNLKNSLSGESIKDVSPPIKAVS